MTETEKRRIQLLQRTKSMYSDKRRMPAVHPRYQSVYRKLYDSPEEETGIFRKGTLGIRFLISILLFVLFITADYKDIQYAEVDSARVIQEIERKTEVNLLR